MADPNSHRPRVLAAAIVAVVLLITALLVPAAIESSVRVVESDLLSDAASAVAAERDARRMFGDDRSLIVALEARTGDVFSADYLRDWNLFLSALVTSDYLRLQLIDPMAIPRIANTGSASSWLVSEQATWSRRSLAGSKLMSRTRISRNERAALLVVPLLSADSQRAVEMRVREAYESVRDQLNGDYELRILGQAKILDALGAEIQADLLRLVPLVVLVVIGLMTVLFRSWRVALIALFEVGVCILWTLGFLTEMGHSVSLMTSLLPVLLMAIGIADEIHLLAEFFRLRDISPEMTRAEAAWGAADRVAIPVTATSFTTAVAFLSFLPGDIPALRTFGLFAAIGVLLSWLLTLTLVPALLTLIPCKGSWRPPASRVRWRVPTRRLLVLALLVSLPILPGLLRLEANDGWNQNFSEDHPIVREARWLTSQAIGVHRLEATLDLGRERAWHDPIALRKLEKVGAQLEKLALVNVSLSVVDLLRDRRWQLGPEDGLRPPLPDSPAEVARLLHAYRLFNEAGLLASMLDREARHASLWVYPVRDDYATVEEVRQSIIRFVEGAFGKDAQLSFSGSAERGRRLIVDLVDTQLASVGGSLILCVAILMLLGAGRRASMLAAASIVWGVALQLGLLGWVGYPLGVATSCFVVLSLGIGIDYSIHLSLGRDVGDRERRSDLVRRIRANVIVVGGGLAVLLVSGNPTIRSLGALLALSMILCGTTAVLLLGRDPARAASGGSAQLQ